APSTPPYHLKTSSTLQPSEKPSSSPPNAKQPTQQQQQNTAMGSTQSKNASGTPRPTRPSNERRKSSKRQQATAEPAKPAPGSIRGTFTAAIDQGTTSSRFIIFDKDGKPQAIHQMEFPQLYPRAG